MFPVKKIKNVNAHNSTSEMRILTVDTYIIYVLYDIEPILYNKASVSRAARREWKNVHVSNNRYISLKIYKHNTSDTIMEESTAHNINC